MKAILRFNLVLFEFLVTLLTLSIHYMKSVSVKPLPPVAITND